MIEIATAIVEDGLLRLDLPSGHRESVTPRVGYGLAMCLIEEMARMEVGLFVVLHKTARGYAKAQPGEVRDAVQGQPTEAGSVPAAQGRDRPAVRGDGAEYGQEGGDHPDW